VALGGVLDINFIPVNKNFHVVAMQRFFKSYQKQREFFATDPEGKKQWEGIQQKLGIKILAHVPVGPACYFSTSRELGSVEAFKGLKSRYLMVTEKASYDAWGVSYVSVQTPEVYSALKQNMIDVVNTVPSAIIAYNWWDFLKFVQQPYHTFHDAYVVANLKWWNTLPQDIQDIVLKRVDPKITAEATASVMTYSDGVLKEMVEKHGGKITTLPEAEIKKFIEIDKAKVFPVIAKEMDPAFYEAARKFAGFN
jgi:TRAP-type C4-dicarboxylate transport system substrate-binding protein